MQALNIFYVLIAIAMVALILVQKGAGATAGAAFGSGASGTVFGARGAGNFLTRTTWVLATLFCTISLLMAVLVSRMSAAPETDLGVMGNAAGNPSAVTQPADSESPGLAELDAIDEGTSVISGAAEELGPATPAAMEAAEDLPAIDVTGEASPEADAEAVGQPAGDDPASGSESDGS